MKKLLLILIIPFMLKSQEVIESSILHNDLTRSYILYIPDSYSETTTTSLVLNLHGYTSNAGQQMIYSNFYPIADEEGFILVHPEGTVDDNGFQFWNSNGTSQLISEVDDINFLSALIDTIVSEYNINTDRVYSMGMSNGGFMSYELACQLSDKIAAIASVTGSMNQSQITSCNPERPIPVMQIHGTSDPTVLYDGNPLWGITSVDDVISYWVDFNDCNIEPIVNYVEDINTFDLCTTEHYLYENGANGSSVELYKVINGGHTWPGALIPLVGNNTNQDFDASEKIWEFFNKYDINGLISSSNINEGMETEKKHIKRIDILGREIKNANIFIDIYNDGTISKKQLIK